MTRISLSSNGSTPFQKLLGHNNDILIHWGELETTFFTKTSLDEKLLEQVRRTLAFGNKCEYCMAKGTPNEMKENQRESFATSFAELFVIDHLPLTNLILMF